YDAEGRLAVAWLQETVNGDVPSLLILDDAGWHGLGAATAPVGASMVGTQSRFAAVAALDGHVYVAYSALRTDTDDYESGLHLRRYDACSGAWAAAFAGADVGAGLAEEGDFAGSPVVAGHEAGAYLAAGVVTSSGG